MSNRRELIQAAYDNWNVNQGVDPEVMRDLGYDTPETLPGTLERVLGEEATAPAAQLELVTEAHQPQPDARRAA
ncbi:MAG TPA: hypothetical protein VM535_00575, partial [Candidatus Saccharimonadales bacterium]|nr:hypothetical protein [Candidatus Saccharimonadales bacterium]